MTTNTARPSAEHLPILDGVRGFAACMVMIGHIANEGMLPRFLGAGSGQMGVCMFFALSGFLMGHRYAHRPFVTAELREYAAHRIGRVAPLYYAIVLLSAIIPAGALWVFSVKGRLAEHLLLLRGQETLWTIPVEMQFYLAFILVWFLVSKGRPILAIALPVVSFAALLVPLKLADVDPDFLPFWGHIFLFGTAAGIAWRSFGHRVDAPAWLGWLAILVLFLALPAFRRMAGIPVLQSWFDPISVGAPVLFFVAALVGAGPMRFFARGAMRWLGKVSYATYLFHFPVLMTLLAVYRPGGAVDGLLCAVLVVAVTLALAGLSYRFFERPAQKRINALAKPRRAGDVEIEAAV